MLEVKSLLDSKEIEDGTATTFDEIWELETEALVTACEVVIGSSTVVDTLAEALDESAAADVCTGNIVSEVELNSAVVMLCVDGAATSGRDEAIELVTDG